MPQLEIKKIYVGDRFRKTFDDIEVLAASIHQYGLINPII